MISHGELARAAAEDLVTQLRNDPKHEKVRYSHQLIYSDVGDGLEIAMRITSDANYIRRTGSYGVKVWSDVPRFDYLFNTHTPAEYIQPGQATMERIKRAVEKVTSLAVIEVRKRRALYPKLRALQSDALHMADAIGFDVFSAKILEVEEEIGTSVYAEMDEATIDKWREWIDGQAKALR